MNVYIGKERLPSAYQEVEYIESTNSNPNYGGGSWSGQYINTGFLFTPNSKISVDAQFKNTGRQQTLFGSYTTNTSYSSIRSYINGAGQWSRGIKDGEWDYLSTNITADTQRHTFILDNSTYKIYTGDTKIYDLANQNRISKNGQYPVYLLADSDYGTITHHTGAKLYSCQIYENGTLVRDFVPCYRKSDNVIGMYDLVNNQFYTNAGTGTFSKGNDVTMTELKNAYIGEYVPPHLCFTANTAGSTVQLTKTGSPTAVTLETSTNGLDWSTYTIGNTITLSNIGDKVYWRNTSTTNTGFSTNTSNYYQFVMNGSISASGDTNYLLNKNSTKTVSNYCYNHLFYNCTSLTASPQLPATTLATYCYCYMFAGCTSLTTAPSLPVTTLAQSCYSSMFNGCTGLTTAPELPATTLANDCYTSMFYGCTSLTSAPKLPATTLADFCYQYMFRSCTSLTTVPELPATTLAPYCYSLMFQLCTGLTTAKPLPATTLAQGCYQDMFEQCTNLTTLTNLPATTLPAYCYDSMFSGCTKIMISKYSGARVYRIPTSGTGTYGTYCTRDMFKNTGGAFKDSPEINTNYYTSNTIV